MEHLHFSTCNAMDKVLKPAMPLSLLGFIVHLAMLLPRSGASSALSNGVEYYHFSTCGTDKVLKYQHRYTEMKISFYYMFDYLITSPPPPFFFFLFVSFFSIILVSQHL